MLVQYRVQEALHLGSPEKQLLRAGVKPGETVVDWGCGPGRATIPVAKAAKGGRVVAVDLEKLALQVVREKAARAGLENIYTVLFESHPISLSTGSADVVLLLDVFNAVADKAGLLSDIVRILRPGGRLFMDPGRTDPARVRDMVEASGLFTLQGAWGRDMLYTKS